MRKSTFDGMQRPGVLKPRNSVDSGSTSRLSGVQYSRKSHISKLPQPDSGPRGGGGGMRMRRISGDGPSRLSAASLRFTPSRNNAHPNTLAAPSSASRLSNDTRSSSMGTVSRKEMRPITDSSFKSRCIDKLLAFLNIYQYEYPVQRRELLTPSAKTFSNVFQFIYRHLDNSYTLPHKFEEEIPRLLKLLHYPVQIPRSSFVTVGSPHTWPSVLAMLDWMVDVIDMRDFDPSDIAFPGDFESSLNTAKLMFTMSAKIFQSNTQEEVDDCNEELRHNLELGYIIRPQDIVKVEEEYEQLEEEEASLMGRPERLEDKQQLHAQLSKDVEKLGSYCQELQSYITRKENDIVSQEKHLSELKLKIQKLHDEVVRLMQLKQDQALSGVDLARYKNHAADVAITSQQLQQQGKDLDNKIWELEVDLGKAMKNLTESVGSYNSLANQLKLPSEFEAPAVLGNDNEGHWQSSLLDLLRMKKKMVKHDAFNAQNMVRQEEDEIYMVKEMLKEKSEELTKLENKLRRMEEHFVITKKEIEDEKQEMLSESERLQEQAKEEQHAATKISLSLYQTQCAIDKSKADCVGVKDHGVESMKKSAEFLVKVCTITLDHLDFVSKESHRFEDHVAGLCSEMDRAIMGGKRKHDDDEPVK